MYASSSGTFLQAFQEIARSLKLPGCDDPRTDPCDLVSQWLKEDDHCWLMILDNADNAELFFPSADQDGTHATVIQTQNPLTHYLPSRLDSRKLLLMTTRSTPLGTDLANGNLCIEVLKLSAQEAKRAITGEVETGFGLF